MLATMRINHQTFHFSYINCNVSNQNFSLSKTAISVELTLLVTTLILQMLYQSVSLHAVKQLHCSQSLKIKYRIYLNVMSFNLGKVHGLRHRF